MDFEILAQSGSNFDDFHKFNDGIGISAILVELRSHLVNTIGWQGLIFSFFHSARIIDNNQFIDLSPLISMAIYGSTSSDAKDIIASIGFFKKIILWIFVFGV